MGRRWFTPKRYGLGWTPVTREGWLVVPAMIAAALTACVISISVSWSEGLAAVVTVAVAAISTIAGIGASCAKRGKPKWNRGDRA